MLAEAFRPCCAHIILAYSIQHSTAHLPRYVSKRTVCEAKDRKHEVISRIGELLPEGCILVRAAQPVRREHIEVIATAKECDEQRSHPEAGQRIKNKERSGNGAFGSCPSFYRSYYPQGNCSEV